jgi:hypothetical protein
VRARYQKGSLTKIKRKNGYLVWLFRWRETGSDGRRRPRNIVVGPVSELRTQADARQQLETLRLNINLDPSEQARPPILRCSWITIASKSWSFKTMNRRLTRPKRATNPISRTGSSPDGESTCWRGWKMAH